ncbi:hypothetical protein BLOT_011749 [Blomia tropicalis]|nr:hypothetical protein BLOT_011749 [Blomia tropicalis]
MKTWRSYRNQRRIEKNLNKLNCKVNQIYELLIKIGSFVVDIASNSFEDLDYLNESRFVETVESTQNELNHENCSIDESFLDPLERNVEFTNTNITKNSESVLSSNQSPDLEAYILKIGRPFNSNENPDVSSSNNNENVSSNQSPDSELELDKLFCFNENTYVSLNSENLFSSNQSIDLDDYFLKIGRPFDSNENPDSILRQLNINKVVSSHHKLALDAKEKQTWQLSIANDQTWEIWSDNIQLLKICKNPTDCDSKSCNLKCTRCNICLHSYMCSCFTSRKKNTICEHIHFSELR